MTPGCKARQKHTRAPRVPRCAFAQLLARLAAVARGTPRAPLICPTAGRCSLACEVRRTSGGGAMGHVGQSLCWPQAWGPLQSVLPHSCRLHDTSSGAKRRSLGHACPVCGLQRRMCWQAKGQLRACLPVEGPSHPAGSRGGCCTLQATNLHAHVGDGIQKPYICDGEQHPYSTPAEGRHSWERRSTRSGGERQA